jgi:hypothetical protein
MTLREFSDAAFVQFLEAYPPTRRKGGNEARQVFRKALSKVSFDVMRQALEQHKRSAQWQNPRFIPSMLTWLLEERWIQVLPEPEPPRSRFTPYEQAKRAGLK